MDYLEYGLPIMLLAGVLASFINWDRLVYTFLRDRRTLDKSNHSEIAKENSDINK